MRNDPYVGLMQELSPTAPRGLADGCFLTGTVTSCGGGAPLAVFCEGLDVPCRDLSICQGLNFRWVTDTGEESLLRRGDTVCMGTVDHQTFYILGKAAPCHG